MLIGTCGQERQTYAQNTWLSLLEQISGPSRIEISQCSQLVTNEWLVSLKIVPYRRLSISGWQFGHSLAAGAYSALVSGSPFYHTHA